MITEVCTHETAAFHIYPAILYHCRPNWVEFWKNEVDFISLLSCHGPVSKPGFTAETQRTLRECSYDPIGRRRLDHKLSPFGNRCSEHIPWP